MKKHRESKLDPYEMPLYLQEELTGLLYKRFRDTNTVAERGTPLVVRKFVTSWLDRKYEVRTLPRVFVDYVDIKGSAVAITFGVPKKK